MCDDHKPRSSGSPCDRCSHVFPRPSCTPRADAPSLDGELDVQSWSWREPEYCSLFSLVVWDLHLFTPAYRHLLNIFITFQSSVSLSVLSSSLTLWVLSLLLLSLSKSLKSQGKELFPQTWMNVFAPWLSLHEVKVSIFYLDITVVDLCLWMLRFVGRYFDYIHIIFFYITCLFLFLHAI